VRVSQKFLIFKTEEAGLTNFPARLLSTIKNCVINVETVSFKSLSGAVCFFIFLYIMLCKKLMYISDGTQ
jgi:hypothetical protein